MTSLFKDLYQKWIKPWDRGESPMEIRRAILDEVEAKVVAFGAGKKLFPFDRLRIHLLAEDPEQRLVLESAVKEGWNLEPSIKSALAHTGSQVPTSLGLEYDITAEADERFAGRRFFIEYGQAEQTETPSGRPTLELRVTQGEAPEEVYKVSSARFHVGRLSEVFDRDGRLERRNDLAFGDEGEVNTTVSRKHATVRYDEAARVYTLRDNNSATGTRIFRDGRSIEVGRHRQGVRLQDGDEISFGRAQVRVRVL